MHHTFGSQILIDTLHMHGFCLSYSEVPTFESSASVAKDPDVHTLAADQSFFSHYIYINLIHQLRTGCTFYLASNPICRFKYKEFKNRVLEISILYENRHFTPK